MEDKFLKRVLSKMKCGVCGRRYEPANVSVLGHREDLWFISVFCSSCHSQGLVAAMVKEGKLPEVITELTEAEEGRFSEAVGSDDLIDVHEFLKEFDGDFSSLFSSRDQR
ncbi:MAG: hypothetical protein NTU41_04660 [Chloroflexi bacterium]|nr:hypothetical protein [Chloroflexota bacterium]